jgi:hypothetical protein
MPDVSPLEDAVSNTMMDLLWLRRADVDLPYIRRSTDELSYAVQCLCEALARPDDEDVDELAHRAHRTVVEVAQMLERAEPDDPDDRRTRHKIEGARRAISALLDALAPLVSGADRALVDVLFRGVPVELAAERLRRS